MLQVLLILFDHYRKYQTAISAGWLSGSLHALTGADHITALLPLAVGQRWYISGIYGGIWGLGHGMCSFMLGYLGFYMKGYFISPSSIIENYRYLGDLVVAITVIIIGVMGVYENASEEEENEQDTESVDTAESNNNNNDLPKSSKSSKRKILSNLVLIYSIFMNGLCLGLSWDGLPSLAPALMLDNWLVGVFLFAYFCSTIVTMAITSGLLGEVTYYLQYGFLSSHPVATTTATLQKEQAGFSNHLAKFASYTACLIGSLWFLLACSKTIHHLTLSRQQDGQARWQDLSDMTNILPALTTADGTTAEQHTPVYSDDAMTSSVLCVGSLLIILGMLLMSVLSIHPTLRTQSLQYMHCTKRRCESAYHRVLQAGRQLIGWKGLKMKEKADDEGGMIPDEIRQSSHNNNTILEEEERTSAHLHHSRHYIVHHVDQMSLSTKFPVTAIV
jgi:hypothetical protein